MKGLASRSSAMLGKGFVAADKDKDCCCGCAAGTGKGHG